MNRTVTFSRGTIRHSAHKTSGPVASAILGQIRSLVKQAVRVSTETNAGDLPDGAVARHRLVAAARTPGGIEPVRLTVYEGAKGNLWLYDVHVLHGENKSSGGPNFGTGSGLSTGTRAAGGGTVVLRSKTPERVKQEFYAFLLTHFCARTLMHEATLANDMDPDRFSFTHAIEVLKRKLPANPADFPPRLPARLHRDIITEIAEVLLPPRRNRSNPRGVKRKMSS
ncbi:MAG: hypothetical protein LBC18_09355 [Opitutaceae bacterium]|nr:hypothetical protein [Opitutaceae bacterium]